MAILEQHGATCSNLKDYRNKTTKLNIICKCGGQVSLTLPDVTSGNSLPRCRACTNVAKGLLQRKTDLSGLEARFKEFGATPDLTQYKSGKHSLPYVCKCGESHSILPTNALKEGRRIECPKCQALYAATDRPPKRPKPPQLESEHLGRRTKK